MLDALVGHRRLYQYLFRGLCKKLISAGAIPSTVGFWPSADPNNYRLLKSHVITGAERDQKAR